MLKYPPAGRIFICLYENLMEKHRFTGDKLCHISIDYHRESAIMEKVTRNQDLR